MLTGIKLKANPTSEQKLILSQWMGCARFVWNAKCDEHRYYSTFARKYCPIGTYAPVDQKASQFKNRELTPWLSDCPSQIIRNSAVNWYSTFDDGSDSVPATDKENLEYLQGASDKWLNDYVVGVDRGVAIPVHTGNQTYSFTPGLIRSKTKKERYLNRLQRRLAKQKTGSNRRNRTKQRISRCHQKVANIRQDLCHKTSRALVDSSAKVIVFEALNTSKMTRKPKAKQDRSGKFLPNRAKAEQVDPECWLAQLGSVHTVKSSQGR